MAVSTIKSRQLADGSITDAKVAAGAAIATSKLAAAADLLLRTGTIAMTGALNMGSQLITNVQTPSTGTDAANKSYVDGLIAGLNSLFDSKPSVRAASTANVTLASPGTTMDGVTLVAQDRVLLKNQTATAENGLYVWTASGSTLTRVTDMDAWNEVPGALVAVEEGSTLADTIWLCTSNQGGTLNTTAIAWSQVGIASGLSSSNFVNREVPSGSINGSNVTFTLANTPTAGTEELYLNGLLQNVGAGNDYTISGATITYLTAPLTGDVLLANYRK